MGHDEYWTTTMRTRSRRARDAGTNLGFLGANTMYWRIRLEDTGTGPARLDRRVPRTTAHLDPMRDDRPAETTARFRDAPAARTRARADRHEVRVLPGRHGLRRSHRPVVGLRGDGRRNAATGIPGLVGPEADRVYPDSRAAAPAADPQRHRRTPAAASPPRTESVYYTVRSGAGVFNAGTLRWGCAIVDRCERPLGRAHRGFVAAGDRQRAARLRRGPVGTTAPGARQRGRTSTSRR